jgi:hypothetical protein
MPKVKQVLSTTHQAQSLYPTALSSALPVSSLHFLFLTCFISYLASPVRCASQSTNLGVWEITDLFSVSQPNFCFEPLFPLW